jgi:D-sedoheptulose 7-phosphate isomerase
MRIRHVILDRDGVLNREDPDGGYLVAPEDFHWLPGALEGLALLHRAGVRLSVATNQSAIGRGLMSVAQLDAVHARMRQEATAAGGALDAVFYCPHAPEAQCECRKPTPGLLRAALDQSGIAPDATLVVGDDQRDLEAARRAGVAAALVRTGKGRATESKLAGLAVPAYDDLPALARALLADAMEEAAMGITEVFAEHARVTGQAAEELPAVLQRIVAAVFECLGRGGTVFACGNGGSAADAQHLVAELIGRFRDERRALRAVALNADTATLTAVANDYGYAQVFARQLEGLARPGDLLFAVTTSGNSPNVVQAARTARAMGCTVVGLTGAGGGELAQAADLLVRAPSSVVARIQEVHALCIHAIADSLDAQLQAANPS